MNMLFERWSAASQVSTEMNLRHMFFQIQMCLIFSWKSSEN